MPANQVLITNKGKPRLGHFDQIVEHINVEDADYRTPFNRPASRWRKHFNFKRFQYFGGVSETVIFGCALADTRYVGAVFVYVYDIGSNELKTWDFKTPLALGMNLSNRQDNQVSRFSLGSKHIELGYSVDHSGERRKSLKLNFGNELQIDACMVEEPGYQSMVQCAPASINGWIYAQKTAALAVNGEIKSTLGHYTLGDSGCFGHTDYSAGFMRRETFWNWACFSGRNNNTKLGLNLSWGVNETGYSENCLWVDARLHPLPQVQFEFDRDDDSGVWKVSSLDGRVDLEFLPKGLYQQSVNALFLANNFKQIFGTFRGTVIDDDGVHHAVDSLYGFVEDQYAKW
jgi:hypothetical protein